MMKGITVGGGNFWRERIPTYVMYYGTLIVGGQKLSHTLPIVVVPAGMRIKT